MANKSLLGFPHRREEAYARRAFNTDYAPRYADLVAWYDMSTDVYADDDGATPAAPGVGVALIKDQSAYGRHMRQTVAAYRPVYGVDSGYPAISAPGTHFMTTTETFAAASSFAVFRANAATFVGNGAVLGRFVGSSTPWYRFQAGGTIINYTPASYTRKNSVAVAVGGSLAPINSLMVLSLDHANPSAAVRAVLFSDGLAGAVPAVITSLSICEVLAYGSVLPPADIVDIEAMLMAKYNLS
jgi:hypothetical protein